MLKVTLREIIGGARAVSNLANQPVPIQTAFRLARVIEAIEKERALVVGTIEKRRDNYEKDDEGNLSEKDKEELDEAAAELLDAEISIDADRIPMSIIGQGVRISTSDAVMMKWLIDEDA